MATSSAVNCGTSRMTSPLREIAIQRVKTSHASVTSCSANDADIYPLDFMKWFVIFRVQLGIAKVDGPSPRFHYVAVSTAADKSVLLRNVVDINNVLRAENLTVSSESTALAIAGLLFDSMNLACDYYRMHIVCGGCDIPGHSEMLKTPKKAREVLMELKKRILDIVDYRESEFTFLNDMLDRFRAIYVDGVIDIDSIITQRAVTKHDNHFVVRFFTWERFEGALKTWQIRIATNGQVEAYMYSTIAMFVGNWKPQLGFFSYGHFNDVWGEYSEKD